MMRLHIAVFVAILVAGAPSAYAQQDSVTVLESHVKENKKDGQAWFRLGQLYYEEDQLDKAQKAFQNAIKRTKSAESYFALGQLYLRRCRVKHQSVYCLRVEANLKKALKADKAFAPARLALAHWYRDSGFQDQMIKLLRETANRIEGVGN